MSLSPAPASDGPDRLYKSLECQRHNAELTLRYLRRYMKSMSPERVMALHRHYEQLAAGVSGMEAEIEAMQEHSRRRKTYRLTTP